LDPKTVSIAAGAAGVLKGSEVLSTGASNVK
jgi:hypothetical protein